MFTNHSEEKPLSDPEPKTIFMVAQLNARLQPMHRGELFEDPLEEVLQGCGVGKITGGGTLQSETGEIAYCDIEIEVAQAGANTVDTIVGCLERLGAPKGSKLRIEADERDVAFGLAEGMAIYLNGTDLPSTVYKECDVNVVYSELDRLLIGGGRILSYWQGPTETALYLYGSSFKEMHERVSGFLATYPLCQRCRIEQIA